MLATDECGMDRDEEESYMLALRECMDKLVPVDRQLIDLPYVEELGAQQIAERMGRSRQSVCNSLSRIRRQLFECVARKLGQEERS